jgi:succinyl-diaminopimelate desuccinylase
VSAAGHEAIERDIRAILAALDFDVDIEVVTGRPPVETDPGARIVRDALEAAGPEPDGPRRPVGLAYFTDASVYQEALGAPVVIYGPGEARLCHQPDEWVSLTKYLEAVRFYTSLACRYLG